ncbi:MAG: helix-hairpin-helix domain-containing protein [Myxococcales bacterium]|nr:MAG: helix-hairpin-helix domain-containing protein [Myxococcales bacterium]
MASQGCLDPNAASAEQLALLPGLGPKRAQAIYTFRAQHGSFASIRELDEVSGIGKKTLERLEPYLCINPAEFAKTR